MAERQDRRVARTRRALVEAYNHLVLHRRQRRIRVADLVEQAGVGRSTFYDHYRGEDALFLEALSRPLSVLADAAAGVGEAERLTRLLSHLWDNRQRARDSLTGRRGGQVARLLAEMVGERLRAAGFATELPLRLVSMQMAEAALAPVRGWLMAEAPATAETLAQAICRAGAAMRSAVGPGGDHKM